MGRNEVESFLFQFADDIIFLCEDSFSNVVTVKVILRCFELVSGLKINFHKSKLADINVIRSNLDYYARCLNCFVIGISFNYFGLVVGGNPRKKEFWEPVVNRISSRLSAWKGRFLSLAGRIYLFFKTPESVYKRIVNIQRRFLWGWGSHFLGQLGQSVQAFGGRWVGN